MTDGDLVKLFTQQLLEEHDLPKSSEDVIEEGFFNRMKVRAKTLKARFKNKIARLGGKVGVYDAEGVARADQVFIEALGEELDKIYKPKFEKLLKKYFKDASVLTGSIIDDHGIDKKQANILWQRLSSPEVMNEVFDGIKLSLMHAVIAEAKKEGIEITSI